MEATLLRYAVGKLHESIFPGLCKANYCTVARSSRYLFPPRTTRIGLASGSGASHITPIAAGIQLPRVKNDKRRRVHFHGHCLSYKWRRRGGITEMNMQSLTNDRDLELAEVAGETLEGPLTLAAEDINGLPTTSSQVEVASISKNDAELGGKCGRPQGQPGYFPKKGDELELICDSLAFKATGVCRVVATGFVVLCERALPGERLIARITRKKRTFAEAFKVRTLVPHDHAVEPPCEHFPACGGCKLQNLAYSAQLVAKQQQVEDLMQRVGRLGPSGPDGPSGPYMRAMVPCQLPYQYRNKMEFSFGSRVWIPFGQPGAPDGPDGPDDPDGATSEEESPPVSPPPALEAGAVAAPSRRGRRQVKVSPNPHQFALGLHAPRRFDKILPITTCHLQPDVANQVLALVREHCWRRREELPPYDLVTQEGTLRHLTIRTARDAESGGLQVSVSVSTKQDCPHLLRPLAEELVRVHPEVVSVVNAVIPGVADVSTGEIEHLLAGRRTISERLRGLTFQISAASFFQTNTAQADVLYGLVEEACQLRGDGSEVLLDLFCGTGTIGLSMAHRVRHVYGYELVPEAVADARLNAERNGIRNATFVQGDLGKLDTAFGSAFERPDVVITDPNRPGMHPKLLRFLSGCGAERIVYVSCNPATCARDVDVLCHSGEDGGEGPYRVVSVQPVDMFPQTPHVECVVVLQRRAPQWQGWDAQLVKSESS